MRIGVTVFQGSQDVHSVGTVLDSNRDIAVSGTYPHRTRRSRYLTTYDVAPGRSLSLGMDKGGTQRDGAIMIVCRKRTAGLLKTIILTITSR
jgi:hypothetical protein